MRTGKGEMGNMTRVIWLWSLMFVGWGAVGVAGPPRGPPATSPGGGEETFPRLSVLFDSV